MTPAARWALELELEARPNTRPQEHRMPYSPPDHLTVHLTRDGDDWRATVADVALGGDQNRPDFQRALLALARGDVLFGPRESAGEALEELGQAIDRLDAARRIDEVRVADGTPRNLPPDKLGDELVARVLEVLDDAAPEPLTAQRIAEAADLDLAATRAALEAAERGGAIGSRYAPADWHVATATLPGEHAGARRVRVWHLKPLGAQAPGAPA